MKRSLNVKLLLWLLGSVALIGGSVHLVHAIQIRRQGETLLCQADSLLKDGQLDRAAIYLNRYLVFEPGDKAVLVKYALTLDKLAVTPGGRWRAVLALEQAK